MRGEYSMTLTEFVFTGLGLGVALIAFIALPDWLVGWVFAGISLVLLLAALSVFMGGTKRTIAPPEDWRTAHQRWEEQNKRARGNASDGS